MKLHDVVASVNGNMLARVVATSGTDKMVLVRWDSSNQLSSWLPEDRFVLVQSAPVTA